MDLKRRNTNKMTCTLKPFHLIHELGGTYVLNVQDLRINVVDDQTLGTLERVLTTPVQGLESSEQRDLDRLGLIAPQEDSRSELSQEKNVDLIPVTSMSLLLTEACNLKCVYCYCGSGNRKAEGRMTEATAYRALDWLLENSLASREIYVNFCGGEPFLAFPTMRKSVKYVRRKCLESGKKVRFHTTSNGTLLDEEKIDFIAEHAMAMRISIDGPREVHDGHRRFSGGGGSYDTIIENCRKLLEINPDVEAHAVLVEGTPLAIKEALLAIGFKQVSVRVRSDSLLGGRSGGRIPPTREIGCILEDLEREAYLWLRHTGERNSQALKELKPKSQLVNAMISLLQNSKRHHGCVAGFRFFAVSCDGSVYPCHRFVDAPEYRLGSIFGGKLERRTYLRPVALVEACAECFARYYCGGGCKYDNAASGGDIFSPAADICQLRRRELEFAASVVGNLGDEELKYLIELDILPVNPLFLTIGLWDGIKSALDLLGGRGHMHQAKI
ncbi:MAG: radical SAM protein [Desulfobulbaceae bacterium]|nr:radical SAM protein [Desulfobulbaceae bacterium]